MHYFSVGFLLASLVLAGTVEQLVFQDPHQNTTYGVFAVNDKFETEFVDYFKQNLMANWTVVNNIDQSIWSMHVMDYHKIGPEPSFFLFGMPNQNAQRYMGTFSGNASSQTALLSLFQQANEEIPAKPARVNHVFENQVYYALGLFLTGFFIEQISVFKGNENANLKRTVLVSVFIFLKIVSSFLYGYYVDKLTKNFEESSVYTPGQLDDFNGNKIVLGKALFISQLAFFTTLIDLSLMALVDWWAYQGLQPAGPLWLYAGPLVSHLCLEALAMSMVKDVCPYETE